MNSGYVLMFYFFKYYFLYVKIPFIVEKYCAKFYFNPN